jgi:hypothetical protein
MVGAQFRGSWFGTQISEFNDIYDDDGDDDDDSDDGDVGVKTIKITIL